MNFDFDLITIGGGSGGVRASRWAAGLGAKVAICEDHRWGGTCVTRGCIPKKLMSIAAHFSDEFSSAYSYGWTVPEPSFSWSQFKQSRDQEIERLTQAYARVLEKAGVQRFSARGRLLGPNKVQIGKEVYTSRFVLLATGGRPEMKLIPGSQFAWSSNDVFNSDTQPESLTIVGGGYVGVEFASIFSGLGTQVHLVYRQPYILQGFDLDVRKFLQEELSKKGIELSPNSEVLNVQKKGDQFQLDLRGRSPHVTSQVLLAVGRRPNTENLGLEDLGVQLNARGAVIVDQNFETNVPGVFAVGDCIDRINLTPVALAQGMFVAEKLFSPDQRSYDENLIPTAVFSLPPVATVGLIEEKARAQGVSIDIYKTQFLPLKHTLTSVKEKTFMKLVVDSTTDKVLGCHMVGESAPEIIQGLAVALKAGASKADFDRTIGIHPTSAEEFVTMRTKSVPD